MVHPAKDRPCVRYAPGPIGVRLALLGTAVGWLAALGALVGTIRLVLGKRQHGDLSTIGRSGPRPLRPIGASAAEVAGWTDRVLAELVSVPNVRVFRGIRPAGSTLPASGHAVAAGRRLVVVESVAWPPGWYRTDADGRVLCDGQYIGQSVRPLVAVVGHLRRLLPRSHRVHALVVVHRTGAGRYALPTSTGELGWTLAGDAGPRLLELLGPHRATVSRQVLAALGPGTAGRVA